MGFCNASVSLADKEEYEHGSSIELEQVSDTVATWLLSCQSSVIRYNWNCTF